MLYDNPHVTTHQMSVLTNISTLAAHISCCVHPRNWDKSLLTLILRVNFIINVIRNDHYLLKVRHMYHKQLLISREMCEITRL